MIDTIAAIATPNATGAIAIIRLSGPNSYSIVSKICCTKVLKSPNTVQHTFIYDLNKKIIDEVVLVKFVKPKSFTGEDVVEINCHGGLKISRMILDLVISCGARLAQPGEFTERAFKNNKINFDQAMSINNLICSRNENSVKLAASGLVKKNFSKIESLKNLLFNVIGRIETSIDYPEYDDIENVTSFELIKTIENVKSELTEILDNNKKISYIQNGIKVAIIGKPNVGKSSLLNAILGEQKVIVSNIPGTTRDTISAEVEINGISFIFSDTAGIRKAKNTIETLGIKKSKEEIKKSDFVFFLIDASKKMDDNEKEIFDILKDKNFVLIKNKSDLKRDSNPTINGINISAKNNQIKPLIDYIYSAFSFDLEKLENTQIFYSQKEKDEINYIITYLSKIINDLNKSIPLDLIIADVEKIYFKLCELTGEGKNIDLIDKMFRSFCLGK